MRRVGSSWGWEVYGWVIIAAWLIIWTEREKK